MFVINFNKSIIMSFKFKGKVTKHLPLQKGKGVKGEWAKATFCAEEIGVEYPQTAVFSLFKNGDYMKYAESFSKDAPVGSEVEVEFNLKCNEWKDKCFLEASVWKVDVSSATPNESSGDDLPF